MKRFYTTVSVVETDGGFELQLDGRVIRTPAKAALIVPTRALADAMAAEWDSQAEAIDMHSMHVCRLANTSIDRVRERMDMIRTEILDFADTDLLCYRADAPMALVAKQEKTWGPYLEWLKDCYGVALKVTEGIMPIVQKDEDKAKLADTIANFSPFELAGLHSLTNALGSIILSLNYMAEDKEIEELWAASQLDETYQEDVWGHDKDAREMRDNKREEARRAAQYLTLLKAG